MRVSPLFMPSLTSLTPLCIVTISLTVSLTMLRQAPESWWSCFWICTAKDVPQERRLSFELVDCVKKIYLHQLGRPSSNLVRTQMEEKKRIRNKDGFSSWRKRFSFFFLQTTKCLVLRLPVLRIYTSHFPFHPYFQSLEKLNIIPRIYWIFSSLGSLLFQGQSLDRHRMKWGHDLGPGTGNLKFAELPNLPVHGRCPLIAVNVGFPPFLWMLPWKK